jgi:hypothetical protein
MVPPTTVVLFRKIPLAYRFTSVPVDEPQVPETEVVLVVITDVVMVGATEVPAELYWQSGK